MRFHATPEAAPCFRMAAAMRIYPDHLDAVMRAEAKESVPAATAVPASEVAED